MNYREVVLHPTETLASSGTKTIDIDVTEPITELIVNFGVTNDTSNVDDTPAQESLTKIEIVDGGQVYHSVAGCDAVGVAAYTLGQYPGFSMAENANYGQDISIPIRFGRYIGDAEYALVPRALLNPQLKITWSNASGMLSTGTDVQVLATVMHDVAAPGKALFTKTIETWTVAASGIHEVDLPVDYPIRRLFARSFEGLVPLSLAWTDFVLDCDRGKLIVFDWDDTQFLRHCQSRFPLYKVNGRVKATHNEQKQTRIGYLVGGNLNPTGGQTDIMGCNPTTPHYMRCLVKSPTDVALTDKDGILEAWGWLPENMYCYEFGEAGKPETWFNAPQYKGIKLKITEGNEGGTGSVLVQQPRSLP